MDYEETLRRKKIENDKLCSDIASNIFSNALKASAMVAGGALLASQLSKEDGE